LTPPGERNQPRHNPDQRQAQRSHEPTNAIERTWRRIDAIERLTAMHNGSVKTSSHQRLELPKRVDSTASRPGVVPALPGFRVPASSPARSPSGSTPSRTDNPNEIPPTASSIGLASSLTATLLEMTRELESGQRWSDAGGLRGVDALGNSSRWCELGLDAAVMHCCEPLDCVRSTPGAFDGIGWLMASLSLALIGVVAG